MANSKLSKDDKGDKYVRTYDDERFLTEEEASKIDWKKAIRIIMIGKTGGGKSATGNTMMGHTWFESSSSSESVTQKGKTGKIKWKDQYIKIVDTPGLFDNLMKDDDIKLEIIKCMTLVVPGPHIIMYMIRIGRYTKEDIEAADKFLKIIGKNPYNWTIIVLTGRDDLEYHNTSKKNYLKTATQDFRSFAKKCGERCIFVNNRSKDSKCEWIEIYSAIDKMLLENKHFYYNNELLQTLNEAFDEIIAERALGDTRIPVEKVTSEAEKEVENGGGILRTLLKSTSVGALTCGMFSAIIELTIPMIAAGAFIGAGGAIVSVGGAALSAYTYKKKHSEIRVVLIGRTGSGISASGNSILKQVCFQSDSSGSSVTKTCCIGTSKRNGMIVKVVDTPGLFSNIMTVDEIKLEILNCFTLISRGPHVIVYVLRIGRFTEEEIQGVKRFLQMFGGNPLQYTMVLFTGQDDLEWNQTSNEEYLNSAPVYLKKMVEACNRRCVFFNNRLSNSVKSDSQLDEFFKTVGKILKENQNEMPYYTNQMCTEIDENDFKAKHKKRICPRYFTLMKRGGVAFATGLFMFVITGDPLFSVVFGIGTGIFVLSYFNYVKETNDTLSKVLNQITDESTRPCAIL